MFSLIGVTIINCNITLSNQKQWMIYQVNEQTGGDQMKLTYNDPSTTTSEIVIQPKTFSYGLYRFVYTVKKDCLYSEVDTFVRIQPSGLMISTLNQMVGSYGGKIEITRGSRQSIKFNPFLNTYDLDSLATIRSLTFKYACQVVDSNIEQGYPLMPNSSSQIIYLDQFKYDSSLDRSLLQCFNSTGNF